jgi:hypothetical protein
MFQIHTVCQKHQLRQSKPSSFQEVFKKLSRVCTLRPPTSCTLRPSIASTVLQVRVPLVHTWRDQTHTQEKAFRPLQHLRSKRPHQMPKFEQARLGRVVNLAAVSRLSNRQGPRARRNDDAREGQGHQALATCRHLSSATAQTGTCSRGGAGTPHSRKQGAPARRNNDAREGQGHRALAKRWHPHHIGRPDGDKWCNG